MGQIFNDFTDITYQTLVYRQRDKTHRVLQTIPSQRHQAATNNVETNQRINHLAPQQTLLYSGVDILRDQYLQTGTIFTRGWFSSNNRAYIGVLQQGIRDDATILG